MATAIIDRGLNLSEPDTMDPAEYEEFKDFYVRTKGYALPAFEFWAEQRADVLKRYRLQARMTPTPTGLRTPLPNTLAFLHYYSIVGYDDGILYEVINAQACGATKAQIVETIAVAFLHAGPRGMRYVATSSQDYLRTYEEPEQPGPWFDNWDVDPEAFRAGLDYSQAELLDGELELIEAWYERVSGEVPSHIRFLGRHRPHVLKAFRHRFEYAIKDGMPKQMMPYLQLHLNVIRGFKDGIREAVLMGRGFGMTDEQLADGIVWGMLYGGPASVSIAAEACQGILDY
jgi:hypothetical protein